MADGIKVVWTNKDKILKALNKAGSQIGGVIKNTIEEINLKEIVPDAQQNVIKNFKSSNFKKHIKGFTKINTAGNIVTGLQVNLKLAPYARIQEFGGSIRPKKKKALTIPFPGVKGFATEYNDTFIAKGIIFQRIQGRTKKGLRRKKRTVGISTGSRKFQGGLRNFRPLFLLHKGPIKITKKPYMTPALKGNVPKIIKALKELDETVFN